MNSQGVICLHSSVSEMSGYGCLGHELVVRELSGCGSLGPWFYVNYLGVIFLFGSCTLSCCNYLVQWLFVSYLGVIFLLTQYLYMNNLGELYSPFDNETRTSGFLGLKPNQCLLVGLKIRPSGVVRSRAHDSSETPQST